MTAGATTTVRLALAADLGSVLELYAELHPTEVGLAIDEIRASFEQILGSPGLTILLLEREGQAMATSYLDVIPNLTRQAAPYAVIENVVVTQAAHGQGLGKLLMSKTLEVAWQAGCYKAMLLTGSQDPATHAFYRACGFDADTKTGYHQRKPHS